MRRTRAIVFDLDDTLYPYRAFVRSGFRTVACRLAEARGVRPADILGVLRHAVAKGNRGRALQELCARFEWPASLVDSLADMIRDHAPTLRLPRESTETLATLGKSWKIGVLTNGDPRVQRRKVAALGVEDLADAVLFASEYGDGSGKPSPSAFHAVLDRLQVSARDAVFAGDDVRTDIAGAEAVGMKAIHVTRYWGGDEHCASPDCRVHAASLAEVPAIADQLVPARMETHAA